MGEHATTVTSKGQVTIPSELRRALNIKPKSKVAFTLVGGELRLRPVSSPVAAGFGAVRPRSSPEDFHRIRGEVEDEMGEDAARQA